MSKFNNVYITPDEFNVLVCSDIPFEGFVIGMGYAYYLYGAVPPLHHRPYNPPTRVPYNQSHYFTICHQYLDTSPKAKLMSVKYRHMVKTGETLLSIARYYGISAKAIMDANPSIDWSEKRNDGELIHVGETLCLSNYELVDNALIHSIHTDGSISGQENSDDKYYIDLGVEIAFSFGPQLGAEASIGNIGGGVWGQGPSINRTIKPYLRYSKVKGWSLGVDRDVYNVRKASGFQLPFYEKEYKYYHGISEHPIFTKVNMNTTRGFEQERINYNLDPSLGAYSEQNWFNYSGGFMIRPGILGFGVSVGIEGLIE
ncbi:MAG: LysM peptidoglycan-binding domain-containing protein [Marinilabiliaceae bacterium]|nr:LysM peptidoglycan-binding domain-containing protein [Marinilabiliaceae bacterium]